PGGEEISAVTLAFDGDRREQHTATDRRVARELHGGAEELAPHARRIAFAVAAELAQRALVLASEAVDLVDLAAQAFPLGVERACEAGELDADGLQGGFARRGLHLADDLALARELLARVGELRFEALHALAERLGLGLLV